MSALVIGIDPGLTTGLCAMLIDGGRAGSPIAVQIHGHEGVVPFVQALLARSSCDDREPLIAIEQFVMGNRSGRSATPAAGQVTRDLIGALQEAATADGAEIVLRSAAQVKPWATDRRLEAAGLIAACAGMRHARDAARHALFAAVHAGLLRDPLSSTAAVR